MITGSQFSKIATSLGADKRDEYLAALNATLDEFAINTVLRQAAFIAQTSHESASFTRLVENLNYSAARLTQVWPKRFPTITLALPFDRKPELIANRVYASRMGNGPEASGDGWRYRGRGFIQITGKFNYTASGEGIGLDLVENPDLLLEPVNAFRSAGWYWSKKGLNALADQEKLKAITMAINGGTIGLDERMKLYAKVKAILAA